MLAGGLPLPEWNVEAAVAVMDRHDVATAILSMSARGVHLGEPADARVMARDVNDFTADVVLNHPDRFGFFATLALPDVETESPARPPRPCSRDLSRTRAPLA